MTPSLFVDIALVPALRLLPDKMDAPEARAMVVAICLQESGLTHRLQMGGPARGYAQFERGGGVTGVLTHPASTPFATVACERLDVAPNPFEVYEAIAYNDVLACVFARLLLWTSSRVITGVAAQMWQMYLDCWRPGKPHPEAWAANFARAWETINAAH